MCKGRLSKSLFHSFHIRSQKPEEKTTDCRQRAVSREQGSQSPPLLMLTCAFFRNERRTRSNQQSSSATAKALVCRQASQLLLRTNKTDTISWHHHEVKKHDPFRSHSILSINNPSQAASSYMITKYLKVTCIGPKIYFFDAHIMWLVLCTTPCCLSGLTLQSPGSDPDSEVYACYNIKAQRFGKVEDYLFARCLSLFVDVSRLENKRKGQEQMKLFYKTCFFVFILCGIP